MKPHDMSKSTRRFIVIDVFGGAIRAFFDKGEAVTFMHNKSDCTLREISLHDVLGDCLF